MNVDCFFNILIVELFNIVVFLIFANYNFKLRTKQLELKAKQAELQEELKKINGKCEECLKIKNKYIHE